MDLARNGAKVCVADINADGAESVAGSIRNAGGDAIAFAVDVSDRAAVCKMIATVADVFDRIVEINTLGILIGTQEAAKQFIAQGSGGKVVNTASIAGKQGRPDYAHYCVSKFGVVSLTQSAARTLAKHRITVNCFAPGVVATELWKSLDGDACKYGVTGKENELIESFSQNILLGRPSGPEDLVGVTTFLASDAASYITGQTVMVDGGMVLI